MQVPTIIGGGGLKNGGRRESASRWRRHRRPVRECPRLLPDGGRRVRGRWRTSNAPAIAEFGGADFAATCDLTGVVGVEGTLNAITGSQLWRSALILPTKVSAVSSPPGSSGAAQEGGDTITTGPGSDTINAGAKNDVIDPGSATYKGQEPVPGTTGEFEDTNRNIVNAGAGDDTITLTFGTRARHRQWRGGRGRRDLRRALRHRLPRPGRRQRVAQRRRRRRRPEHRSPRLDRARRGRQRQGGRRERDGHQARGRAHRQQQPQPPRRGRGEGHADRRVGRGRADGARAGERGRWHQGHDRLRLTGRFVPVADVHGYDSIGGGQRGRLARRRPRRRAAGHRRRRRPARRSPSGP